MILKPTPAPKIKQHPTAGELEQQARKEQGERLLYFLTVPIRTRSEANQREHWAVKAKRVKSQRTAIGIYWRQIRNTIRAQISGAVDLTGLDVTLTRLAPRELDDDNLSGSFKAIRDQIASELCLDDRDKRIKFRYDQRKQPEYGVEVRFEAR